MIDNTVNRAGPGNMMPHHPLQADAVTALVDDFIRDKWLPPERRMEEIAIIYKGERDAARREVYALRQVRDENERLRAALEAFASDENWLLGAPFDPDSPSFAGTEIARVALSGGRATHRSDEAAP